MGKWSKFFISLIDNIFFAAIAIILLFYFLPEYFLIGTVLIVVGFIIFVVARAYLILPYLGDKGMVSYDIIGKVGTVTKKIDGTGKVLVGGTLWNAKTENGSVLEENTKVKVIQRKRLTLYVVPIENQENQHF